MFDQAQPRPAKRPLRFTLPLTLIALAAIAASGLDAQELDPKRLKWSQIDYEAKKLLLTGRASISVGISSPRHSPSGKQVASVDLATRFLSRTWRAHLEGDAFTGVTTSFERFEERGKDRASSKRLLFTPCATEVSRHDKIPPGVDSGTHKAPAEFWAGARAYEEPFPPDACTGKKELWLMDPANLLYAIAASSLTSEAGQEFRWSVLADETPVSVVAKVTGLVPVSVDYEIVDHGGASKTVRGSKDLLQIKLSGESLSKGASGSVEIELLGLKGDALEVFVDLETNAPLEIRGPLSGLGTVRVRAKRVLLY